MRERVVVAMSGGVDSSVAAALMVEAGHEVVGITMQLYDRRDTPAGAHAGCCSVDDAFDARAVADALGIAHYVVDFEEAFGRAVVRDLVESYARGRTPNPCVRCNEVVKFRLLLDRALQLGASRLVTGHYARIERDATGRPRLLRGTDRHKDQSYFLYCVDADRLSKLHFPLGALSKPEVRSLAARFGLPTARKRESQDVCFVAGEHYGDLVERHRPDLPREGWLVALDGTRLGRHRGAHRFTVGQRRGLGLGGGKRRYVVRVDPASGDVVVGAADDLRAYGLTAHRAYWPSGRIPEPGERLGVQVRYRSRPVPAAIAWAEERRFAVRFEGDARAVAAGQSAVLYDGDEVIGGGTIEAVDMAAGGTARGGLGGALARVAPEEVA